MFRCFLACVAILFSGCYKINSTDDLRAVSVTNNPNIVPESSKVLPTTNLLR